MYTHCKPLSNFVATFSNTIKINSFFFRCEILNWLVIKPDQLKNQR